MIERDPTASLPVPTSPGLPVKTSGSTALAVYKTGALAAGAIAIGALAIGALAIGRIAVGDLMLRLVV
jgi:hypothetical protein